MSKQWFLAWGLLPTLLLPFSASAAEAEAHEQYTRVTTNRIVESQQRRTFEFPASGITFDTKFDGARADAIEQTGTSSFTVRVDPENAPINDSAWYAFRGRSESTQSVTITFSYPPGEKHRYVPRLSHDRVNWRLADTNDSSPATLSVTFSGKPLYISGQELFTTEDYEEWISGLKAHPFVKHRQLGTSTMGKPLHLLDVSEAPANADMVLVLGRQHPPEVTGAFALQSFVETLCGPSAEASTFRKKFRLIVVPVINPDGVDAGHWRHNAKGVDLNRDWGQFNQVETRKVSSELLDVVMNSTGKVRFGLDFHSTRRDVFYTTHSRDVGDGSAERWLKNLQELTPDYEVRAQPGSDATRGPTYTSAAWMRRVFDAPAITYEVGDQTDRALIRTVACNSAVALMQVLSEQPSRQAQAQELAGGELSEIRVALYNGAGVSGAGPGKILEWFKKSPSISVQPITAAEIKGGKLRDYDVVIFPGGTGSGQSKALGEDGREQVRQRLRDGGGYIGICAGSYLASSGSPSNLQIIDAKTVSPKWQRGTGMVGIRVTSDGTGLLKAPVPTEATVKYQNGPILMPAGIPDLDDYAPVAMFTSEVADNDTPKGIMTGSPAAVAGTYGKGRVMCFSPHPEQTPGLEPLVESAIKWAAEGSAKADVRP
jgi:glutamine amidotransferase-like uncharacterized protein/predicted deacylase